MLLMCTASIWFSSVANVRASAQETVTASKTDAYADVRYLPSQRRSLFNCNDSLLSFIIEACNMYSFTFSCNVTLFYFDCSGRYLGEVQRNVHKRCELYWCHWHLHHLTLQFTHRGHGVMRAAVESERAMKCRAWSAPSLGRTSCCANPARRSPNLRHMTT